MHRMSQKQKLEIEDSIAAHLGIPSGLYPYTEQMSEDDEKNEYENHFVINVDNGKMLRFSDGRRWKMWIWLAVEKYLPHLLD